MSCVGCEFENAGRLGRRTIAVDDFFVPDGIHNNVLRPGELVVRVRVPARSRGLRCGCQKLRPRAAIDFPMLSVAFAARVAHGACEEAALVVSAIAARPRVISGVPALVKGKSLDEALAESLA